MSVTLYEYPAQPGTDEQVLGRRRSYAVQAWTAPIEYEITIDPYMPVAHEQFRATQVFTFEHLRRDEDHAKGYVARELRRVVAQYVERLTQGLQGYHEAAQRAPAHLRRWQQTLVECVLAGQQDGWTTLMAGTRAYGIRAEINQQIWRQAAHAFNQANRHAYYQAQQNIWGYPATATGSTMMYATVNNTNVTANDLLQWAMTSGTAVSHYYSSDSLLSSWAALPDACECQHAGTCTHCVSAARAAEERRRKAAKLARQQIVAAKRGRKLLLSILSEEQLREYAKTKCFKVTAADGRVFRLRKSRTAELLTADGVADASYCIHLDSAYVAEDTLIAQMLLLQNDPQEFEQISNVTKLRRPDPVDDRLDALYRERHVREMEAVLRSEGIADPARWMLRVQQQAEAA